MFGIWLCGACDLRVWSGVWYASEAEGYPWEEPGLMNSLVSFLSHKEQRSISSAPELHLSASYDRAGKAGAHCKPLGFMLVKPKWGDCLRTSSIGFRPLFCSRARAAGRIVQQPAKFAAWLKTSMKKQWGGCKKRYCAAMRHKFTEVGHMCISVRMSWSGFRLVDRLGWSFEWTI